jgi:hypothetical protein
LNADEPDPPVAADDFAEFAEPPRFRPEHAREPKAEPAKTDDTQGQVDDVIARLRRERAEGKR